MLVPGGPVPARPELLERRLLQGRPHEPPKASGTGPLPYGRGDRLVKEGGGQLDLDALSRELLFR